MAIKDVNKMSSEEKAVIMKKVASKKRETSTLPIVERVTRLILQQEPAEPGHAWAANVAMKSDFCSFTWDSCELTKICVEPHDNTLIQMVRDTLDEAGMASVADVLRPEIRTDFIHAIFIGVGNGYPVFGAQLGEYGGIKVKRVDDDLPEYDIDKDHAAEEAVSEIAKLFDAYYANGEIPLDYLEDDPRSGFQRFVDEMGLGDLFNGDHKCDGDCGSCEMHQDEDEGETDQPEIEGAAEAAQPEVETGGTTINGADEAAGSVAGNVNPANNQEAGGQE